MKIHTSAYIRTIELLKNKIERMIWDYVKAKELLTTENTETTESIDTFDKLPIAIAQQTSDASFIDSFLCVPLRSLWFKHLFAQFQTHLLSKFSTTLIILSMVVFFSPVVLKGQAVPHRYADKYFQLRNEIGKEYKTKLGMEFVRIAAGEFQMGCSKEIADKVANNEKDTRNTSLWDEPGANTISYKDKNCGSDEKPVHVVKISKPFYMGKHEITQGQWKQVMGKNPSYFVGENCKTLPNCDNHPVEQVSWNDIQEFITELNRLTPGVQYRLPTEAEWEYAARGWNPKGITQYTTNIYPSGDDPKELGDYAWYSENSVSTTHPVGQKKPNGFGLYDMSGNVWEWVEDWYDGNYYSTEVPVKERFSLSIIDPKGPVTGSRRVNRGGSWRGSAEYCRSSYRSSWNPGLRSDDIGFRLVLVP